MALIVGVLLAAGVALFARVSGFDRDRAFYPTVLIIVAALYVLFAVVAGGGPPVWTEILFFASFAVLAVIGFRVSLWFVVAGLALHGLFDLVRHSMLPGHGVPSWWPGFCGGYDVVAAAILAGLLVLDRRSARAPASIASAPDSNASAAG